MEGGEVGAQVAAPVFFHSGLPGQFHEAPKKRSFPWQSNPTGFHQTQVGGSNQPNPAGNWNPSSWNWDSIRFTARHVPDLTAAHNDQSEQRRTAEECSRTSPLQNNMVIGGGEGLTLNIGGGVFSRDRQVVTSAPSPATAAPVPAVSASTFAAVTVAAPAQELAARPNKRVRSGSPGNGGGGGGGGAGAGGGYPMCQVDDCRADLSSAKDYHRRHKVCEVHSKTTKALVGKQMQRFCQQCSRFHPLSEFDEGKRSCRRRLAGHNRRRRKTQPTDVASQLLLPGNQDGISNANLNLVNIITALARLQGNGADKSTSIPPMPDRDGLIQIISKISSLNGANQPAKSPPSGGGFDLNVSEETNQDLVEQLTTTNGTVNQAAPSTLNLLAVLSAATLAASVPNKPIVSNSQGSSDSSGNDKGKTQFVESPNDVTTGFTRPIKEQSLSGPSLGLQLFGSSGDESPAKMGSTTTKYLSSESSNPMEEQSPSASPPITHKFFPIHSANEVTTESEAIRISDYREDGMPVEVSTSRCQPFDLFKDMDKRGDGKAARNGAYPVNYASSSGSDHSPSTSNSDAQDRTGRIVFKLFGKDPSCFPQNIRDQINNWLLNSPTDMESYIRPGCVVLSVYLSMPAFAWDELEENLLERVTSLVESSESDFWKNGRFIVRTNRQLVSHNDGVIRLSKSWRTWSSPEVACVSPVAVVCGQKTSLVLRGRNLTVPGTKIYCTHMGKYLSKEILCSSHPGTIYDDSSIERFDLPGDEPLISRGRCFIEVDNGFKGNSFPIIVASSAICQELRALEAEFEEVIAGDMIGEENGPPRSREEVLHFLNELGWLFQKEANYSSISPDLMGFSVIRFKYLLIFSVERDWCVVTKTLLDMLTKMSSGNETLAQESLETVGEIHLLNRAVRRKCRKMVDMLLHFAVILNNDGNKNNNNSNKEMKMYPFIPNLAGPNRWTPLHLAASFDAADEIIDALTDDPQQIGLSCWDTLLDDSKQTPQMYAVARNKHSYNELVMRKRIDRNNGQVSISLGAADNGISMDKSVAGESSRSHISHALQINAPATCAQCAMMESVPCTRTSRRGGLLPRSYVLTMLGIAAVCVCVCLFMRGRLRINYGRSFKWENLDYGPF